MLKVINFININRYEQYNPKKQIKILKNEDLMYPWLNWYCNQLGYVSTVGTKKKEFKIRKL